MQAGIIAGFVAYIWWGLSSVYWGELSMIAPLDVIAHRALWTVPIALAVLVWKGGFRKNMAMLASPKIALVMATSAFVVSFNWVLFVWSVSIGKLADASLGYFILPLVNVLFGMLFFRERPTRAEQIAILFAMGGIGVLLTDFSHFPWIAIGIAISFGVYGFIRKAAPLDSAGGLFVESLVLSPFALAWIIWFDGAGLGAVNGYVDSLLLLAGFITAVPLIAYASAARQLTMIALGMLFYINPTIQILLAVFYFGEDIPLLKLVAFSLVWTGLIVLTAAKLKGRKKPPSPRKQPEPDHRHDFA